MIKTVLVRASDDASSAAYAVACCVARRFHAHIDVLHVRFDPVEVAVAMSSEGAGGTLLQGIINSLERDADAGEAKTRSRFTTFCSDAGFALIENSAVCGELPAAEFHVESGQEARWMCTYGRTSDLVIAPRGTPGEDAVARSTLKALLFETGRPL